LPSDLPGWIAYLFSFSGRINRAKFWLLAPIELLFAIVADLLPNSDEMVSVSLQAALVLTNACVHCAVVTKRLHDLNKSAWWLLIFVLLPAVLAAVGFQMIGPNRSPTSADAGAGSWFLFAAMCVYVWAIAELGGLRGTRGMNKYGPDLLGQVDTAVFD